MMLEVLTITVGVASTAIRSGFKPRFEKYFKKFELKPQQVRAHTERLYREVYKPMSQVFVAEKTIIRMTNCENITYNNYLKVDKIFLPGCKHLSNISQLNSFCHIVHA